MKEVTSILINLCEFAIQELDLIAEKELLQGNKPDNFYSEGRELFQDSISLLQIIDDVHLTREQKEEMKKDIRKRLNNYQEKIQDDQKATTLVINLMKAIK